MKLICFLEEYIESIIIFLGRIILNHYVFYIIDKLFHLIHGLKMQRLFFYRIKYYTSLFSNQCNHILSNSFRLNSFCSDFGKQFLLFNIKHKNVLIQREVHFYLKPLFFLSLKFTFKTFVLKNFNQGKHISISLVFIR